MADQKISELNEKTTPADTDLMALVDIVAAPDETKKVTWANVKATLKTYFDTLYAGLTHATRHQSGGADAIKLDDLDAPDDNTDLDASGAKHGLMPKADKSKLDGVESGADVTGNHTCDTPGGAGTDITAIHDNVAAEISAVAEKGTPVGADLILIEDSAAANTKKKVQLSNLPAGTPGAHKDTHDPEDGADPLDTAAPSELAGVQGSGAGSSHSLARADHQHQIQHGIVDNHLVTVDQVGGMASGEFVRATANGIESRSEAEIKADMNLEDADIVDAVEAAGLDLASGKNIKVISALTSDHTWSGLTAILTAGENLAIGDAVYVKSDGKAWKADADASSTMPVVAIATATISADSTGEFLLLGFMRDDTWDWTAGGILYGSTTAGSLTQTAPSGSGDQVQVIGVAVTADIIMFRPSLELVEI